MNQTKQTARQQAAKELAMLTMIKRTSPDMTIEVIDSIANTLSCQMVSSGGEFLLQTNDLNRSVNMAESLAVAKLEKSKPKQKNGSLPSTYKDFKSMSTAQKMEIKDSIGEHKFMSFISTLQRKERAERDAEKSPVQKR